MGTPKSPAIVRAETVEEIARHTVRWTSLVVLAISFIGTIMAFNGSWPTSWRLWEHVSLVAVIAGVLLQGFCTLMEWANRRNHLSPQYLGPLLLDVGSTYVGFAPIFAPLFLRGLERATLPSSMAQVIAHLAVVLMAWWFAYYPEQNLVRE